jgi:hydroxymethylbilane synthase
MSSPLRIGTRGSQLALWQANEVARLLRDQGIDSEIVTIRTTGDRQPDVPLASIGGKGLFIKELEEALLRDEIDLAIHSLKDVPSILPRELILAAFLERADARDAWLQIDGRAGSELPAGASIGTSAPRRRAQLRAIFPHLRVVEMRGNVDTRMSKLKSGSCDAAVLAVAGLQRLGRSSEITMRFPVDVMTPGAGQGVIAIEAVPANRVARAAAATINHRPTETVARCERALLEDFGGILDCYSAAGVHARLDGATIRIDAFFSDPEGREQIRHTDKGTDATQLVHRMAAELRRLGVIEIIGKATA